VVLDAVVLMVGMAALLAGANALVTGSSQLARGFGVSELVIGLTVVAFGTSAPELAVNGLAALAGDSAIAFGNIVGSNIANIGLIVGVAALIRPLPIHSSLLRRDLPMMLLAALVALFMGLDTRAPGPGVFDRREGFALLLLFAVFLGYNVVEVAARRGADALTLEAEQAAHGWGVRSLAWAVTLAAMGLTGLVIGGHLVVTNAVSLADRLAIPETIVGLTVVAVGTSLPELVTSLVATWKGQADLAVGNVVGSNIFNLLFILGATAVVAPVPVPQGGALDLEVMTGLSIALLAACMTRTIVERWEGGVLLLLYAVYLAARAA